jgi:hypothetical protein
MPAIKANFGSGGANLTPNDSAGQPTLAQALRASVDDVAELRTTIIELLQKLDADSGDTGGDSDYESLLTPAAQTLTKG